VTVVGVIPTLQTVEVGAPDEATYYEPVADTEADARFIVVRAPGGMAIPRIVSDAVRAVDPAAYVKVSTLADRITARTGPARLGAWLGGVIGLLALMIAAVGIHGIVSHGITCRTREIGVRMALGAERADVLRLLVTSSLRGVLIGALAGVSIIVVTVVAASQPLRAALFGLTPLDPPALFSAAAVLLAITFAAAYVPARRALTIRPLDALRHDG
jgi:predicted lysophospholipase L1 biosynthesis ABC-type transport system permease subunit